MNNDEIVFDLTAEEAKIRLAELKRNENRPVDNETIEKIKKLKTQVYNVKKYTDELEKLEASTPELTDDIKNKNYNDYVRNKSVNTSSVACTIISIILAILVIVAYVWFCIYDVKNGLDVFYPVEEGFTLTYLFKVIFIGLFGGIIACGVIILLGVLLDNVISNIKFEFYDTTHKKELDLALEADKKASEEYFNKFNEENKVKIEEITSKLNEAKEFVYGFIEIDDEIKTVEEIDRFCENMTFVMGDGVPFDIAYIAFYQLYKAEKEANLYYFTIFPLMKYYNKAELDKLATKLLNCLNDKQKYFTNNQWQIMSADSFNLYVPIFVAIGSLGKADVKMDRIKKIKSKKEATAFYKESLFINNFANNVLEKHKRKMQSQQ